MPRREPSVRIPKLRRQRLKGRADLGFVQIDKRRVWLGRWGDPATKSAYRRLIAEWIENDGHMTVEPDDLTVIKLIARFIAHANKHYRRADGSATSEVANFKDALKSLKDLYGDTPAAEFTPNRLRAVRKDFIRRGWCRTNVNMQTRRIRAVLRWGVSRELVPPRVLEALKAVEPLKAGRSDVRESGRITSPVPQEHIDAIEPHVSRQVWAMVILQLLTGARAGEITGLRPLDIDMSKDVWTARLDVHKMGYKGTSRMLFFGPRAQEIIRPFLANRPVDAFLFSPSEAEEERRRIEHEQRKTPMSCGNKPGSNRRRKPQRQPGDRYDVHSYTRAITRACRKTEVPHWSSHRLRHTAATFIRSEFGLEAAQVILGHARADVTQVYAEVNAAKAIEVMRRVG